MILAKLRLKRNVQKVLNKRPTLKSIETTDGSVQFKFLSEFKGRLNNDWFDAEYWLSLKKVTGTSKGRFTTYFIETDNNNDEPVEMVLRHYYRGGMVRHFNKDKFLFKNVNHSRAYLEFELLAKMWEIGLPVPRPLACRVEHHTLSFYSNDILIERITGAKDAYNLLLKKELTPNVWNEIGKTIKLFHNNNVFHADLNIHNILISNQTDITLIDFDRCEFRLSSEDWKYSNLERLKRSLLKEKGLNSNFHFNEQNWHELLAGYKE